MPCVKSFPLYLVFFFIFTEVIACFCSQPLLLALTDGLSAQSCLSQFISYIFFNHRDRLTASDMIHVKKVMEHVYEKIVLSDNSSNSSNGGADKMPPDELSALADAKVEIHCNDMVSVVFFLILFPWKTFAIRDSIDSVIVSEELQSVTKISSSYRTVPSTINSKNK